MRNITLLDETDRIHPEDWCRPLELFRNYSGEVHDATMYGGHPENNLKWVKVKYVFGSAWDGMPIHVWTNSPGMIPYEFARGDIPESHQLDVSKHYVIERR